MSPVVSLLSCSVTTPAGSGGLRLSGPGEHFARYDALRAQGGMHLGVAGPGENPFWLVTQMEQVRHCFQDPATFSSSASWRLPP